MNFTHLPQNVLQALELALKHNDATVVIKQFAKTTILFCTYIYAVATAFNIGLSPL